MASQHRLGRAGPERSRARRGRAGARSAATARSTRRSGRCASTSAPVGAPPQYARWHLAIRPAAPRGRARRSGAACAPRGGADPLLRAAWGRVAAGAPPSCAAFGLLSFRVLRAFRRRTSRHADRRGRSDLAITPAKGIGFGPLRAARRGRPSEHEHRQGSNAGWMPTVQESAGAGGCRAPPATRAVRLAMALSRGRRAGRGGDAAAHDRRGRARVGRLPLRHAGQPRELDGHAEDREAARTAATWASTTRTSTGSSTVKVATSLDLLNWTLRGEPRAGRLARRPSTTCRGGGGPGRLREAMSAVPDGTGNCLTLRYYATESALLSGVATRERDPPAHAVELRRGDAQHHLRHIHPVEHPARLPLLQELPRRTGRHAARCRDFDPGDLDAEHGAEPSTPASSPPARRPTATIGDRDGGFYDGANQRLFEAQLGPGRLQLVAQLPVGGRPARRSLRSARTGARRRSPTRPSRR